MLKLATLKRTYKSSTTTRALAKIGNLDYSATSTPPVEFPQRPHGQGIALASLDVLLTNWPHSHTSNTPRPDLTLKFQGLALVDSDEEYESDNYTFSPKAATGCKSTEQANAQTPSNQTANYCCVEPEHNPQASGRRDKTRLSPASVAPPAARVSIHTPYLSQSKSNYVEYYDVHVQGSNLPLGHGSEGRNKVTERSLDNGRELSLLDLGGNSEHDGMEEPREKFQELGQQLDRHRAKMKDPSENPRSFVLPTVDTGDNKAANHKLESPNLQHEQKDLPDHVTAGTPTDYGDGKVSRNEEEENMAAVDVLNLHPKATSIHVSTPAATEPLTAELKSNSETAASLDFDSDSIARSIFGAGFWIEEGPHDLLSLDIEGPCDFYSMGNDLGTLDEQFAPSFRTCHGNSTPGSTPQRNTGGNSSESGSRGTRQSPPNGGGSHRKHPSEGGEGAGEEKSKKAKTVNGTNKRFVCPFYIHDPAYFNTSEQNGQKYTLCAAGIGFADIARVKEHLKRVHAPEIACARCGLTFKKQHDLDAHLNLRNETGPECPVLELPAPRSMTPDMVAQLAERGKRETNLSEEEKWLKIYQILFPNDPRPTTGAYRQAFDQPPTPAQDKHTPVPQCESDLPRLLEQRVDTQLSHMELNPDCREQITKMVISELLFCMNHLSGEPSETPHSFDESQVLRHKPSEASSIDSGYGSRCGNNDCMGNCNVCEQLGSPMSHQSQGYVQPLGSPFFDPTEQYFNPSVLTNPESTERFQSTENMDELHYMDEGELLDLHFPPPYSGNPYLHGSGT